MFKTTEHQLGRRWLRAVRAGQDELADQFEFNLRQAACYAKRSSK